jgi:Holliday junction resolvase
VARTNYQRGADFERRVRDKLYGLDAVAVVRSAGSRSKIDLVALFPALDSYMTWPTQGDVWIVQCKRDGKLPADERDALLSIADATGTYAYLAHTGPNGRGVEFSPITMEE